MRQLPDIDFDGGAHDGFSTAGFGESAPPASAATSSLVITGQEFDLDVARHVARQQMNGVAVAAHHAGRRRDVVGDDPVAALAREFCLGVLDQVFGLGGKADHQRRPLVAAVSRSSPGCRDFRPAAAAACRRMSFSVSARLHWRRASRRRRRRRSRYPPAARLPPAAACRARIPRASRDTPAGSSSSTGPEISVTSAPAACAAAAMAKPCLPEERLAM